MRAMSRSRRACSLAARRASAPARSGTPSLPSSASRSAPRARSSSSRAGRSRPPGRISSSPTPSMRTRAALVISTCASPASATPSSSTCLPGNSRWCRRVAIARCCARNSLSRRSCSRRRATVSASMADSASCA
ncbi:Uncharacterised protein [Bordetella pertussis]|nr:Uncharacterised protein [Bordetella pertussis]